MEIVVPMRQHPSETKIFQLRRKELFEAVFTGSDPEALERLRKELIQASATGSFPETEIFQRRRKQLVQIQDDLIKASPTHKLSFEGGSFRIQYGATCAPTPESLFMAEIQITPLESKKNP